jgi:hypothetical protein
VRSGSHFARNSATEASGCATKGPVTLALAVVGEGVPGAVGAATAAAATAIGAAVGAGGDAADGVGTATDAGSGEGAAFRLHANSVTS